ncbi:MAG: DUF294 nucleotidyltransferase-like domain-containing protein [Heyndrickxia sp.]
MEFCFYKDLKEWKDENIVNYSSNITVLNDFHDKVMRNVIEIACRRMEAAMGELPCRFTWFVMGSAGRAEQGVISDQDHGIIYEDQDEICDNYFRCFGKEISDGMEQSGYPSCHGNVMSSNPKWCKSLSEWTNQLTEWMQEESIESLRYLHIFLDGRAIVGENSFLFDLKQKVQTYTQKNIYMFNRLSENIQHFPKGLGPLGQFMLEANSSKFKMINIKKTVYMPYVNIIRLLSIKNGVKSTSTLQRIEWLMKDTQLKKPLSKSKGYFEYLLAIRIQLSIDSPYDLSPFLNVKKLNQEEKKIIKRMMKDVVTLHESVGRIIRKRDRL